MRPERRAKNEVFFRESNELLERAAAARGRDDVDFVCECARLGCVERLPMTVQEYEHVRRSGGERFVVVPGHEDLSLEVVVETHDGYRVVEKIGVAAVIAREADPR